MNELMDARFYEQIRSILETARNQAYSAANSAMVQAYWSIGKSIVEQQGKSERAEYGRQLLQELSKQLTHDFGKGFTASNLRNMRQFYLTFSNCYALRSNLSWTHYRMLMRVENEKARNFYLKECEKANWSTRQLERQIDSFFYERLLSSRNKETVSNEILSLEPAKKPEDVIHDPYVLEFLGMKQSADFYEKDLESALIGELQNFLLELGRGFSFVARQKHIDLDGEHFYIDLVFYNYILKCFVLIDLKTTKITHQDVGQMDMYIRMYDEMKRNEGDNPTLGIVLCSDTDEDIAKYSVLHGHEQLFASKYKTCLPSEEQLREEIEIQKRFYYLQKKEDEELGENS